MTEVKIENIEANFDAVLELVGQDSYINWDGFTKSSTNLTKQMEELSKQLAVYRDIQQRRFISTMKKLKGYDIPDLIKTVRAKKLPKEALKTIIGRFKLEGEKLELVEQASVLKTQATKLFEEYNSVNETITSKLKETSALIQLKIQESGLHQEVPVIPQLVSTFKHNFDEARIQAAASVIQVEYLPGTVDTLHIKTYAQIVESTLQLVKSEYRRLTQDARKKQRALFSEPKKYVDSLLQYLTNTEVLVIEGQKTIAAKLGITSEKMEESQNMLMQKGLVQNLLMIQSSLRTRVKESMTPEKEATLEQAKQILRYQVTELKSKVAFFKELFGGLEKTPENYQLIPMLLALSLNDLVFEKYGLEQEDFMKNVGDNVIMTNPEVMNIFRDMESAIIVLMQELGIISPEAGQMMQNQTQFPNNGQQPQLPTGLPPGTNPMDLLQLQQLAQLEQMQKFMQLQQAQQNQK